MTHATIIVSLSGYFSRLSVITLFFLLPFIDSFLGYCREFQGTKGFFSVLCVGCFGVQLLQSKTTGQPTLLSQEEHFDRDCWDSDCSCPVLRQRFAGSSCINPCFWLSACTKTELLLIFSITNNQH